MYCPNCGHNNEEQARFCEECGTPLQQAVKKECPRCRAVIQEEGVRYCPECGYPLGQAGAQPEAFQGAVPPTGQGEAAPLGQRETAPASGQPGDPWAYGRTEAEGEDRTVLTAQNAGRGAGSAPGRTQIQSDFKPFVEEGAPQEPVREKKRNKENKEKEASMVPVVVLGILTAVLAAAVVGLAIWYMRLSKEADTYEVPDFSEIIEESAEAGETSGDAEEPEEEEPKVTVTATPTVTLAPTATPTEAPKEHRYELVIEDCTWEEARQKCADKGGYLAVLETEEEWEALIKTIELNGLSDKQFFIGARRDLNGSTYYWVDAQNQLTGESLNEDSSVMKSHWMQGEPSYQDQSIPEYCVNMYYYKNEGRWVLNDIPNAILEAVKSYSGKIGYICEYEE